MLEWTVPVVWIPAILPEWLVLLFGAPSPLLGNCCHDEMMMMMADDFCCRTTEAWKKMVEHMKEAWLCSHHLNDDDQKNKGETTEFGMAGSSASSTRLSLT